MGQDTRANHSFGQSSPNPDLYRRRSLHNLVAYERRRQTDVRAATELAGSPACDSAGLVLLASAYIP